ncbi:MAG: Gfo/Idh/MocA family oxidoreductase, partial [Anaerolineae bacterium]|nr:Gfo/Idh/MocA family oxidoreductase [Anaerolineae bacterium]
MSDTMQIGLWGCGVMGRSLAQALWATGEARLAAVYDTRPDVAAALAGELGGQAVGSAEALLGTPGLDGVIIALPPDLHAPATEAAAAAGLDILVEKPM